MLRGKVQRDDAYLCGECPGGRDGLVCFRAVTTANCLHKAVVTGGEHPNDLPQFRWINTLLENLKASLERHLPRLQFRQVCLPAAIWAATASASTDASRWPS